MEFVIISGLSGAGKSKTASFLEDMGFYVVDNLPAPLISGFAQLCLAEGKRRDRVALVSDIRAGQIFEGLFEALDALQAMDCPYKIVFVEAAAETIIKRYKETRRSHPLSDGTRSLEEAVALERATLAHVRSRADYIIDTTVLSTAKLRGEVSRLFGDGTEMRNMTVSVTSFGYKYGIPMDADLVFDVRFLPNPFYMDGLREQTGLDEAVYAFLFGYQQTKDFLKYLERMLDFLLPRYVEEGRSELVVAIGCTGGQHRSVALTRYVAEFIRRKGYTAAENHRDMTRA